MVPAIVAGAGLLAWAAPPGAWHPAEWPAAVGSAPPDQVVALAAWLVGWFALARVACGVALLAAGALPGALGTVCDAAGRALTPRFLRALLGASVSAAVVTGGGVGHATSWPSLDRPGAAPGQPAAAADAPAHGTPALVVTGHPGGRATGSIDLDRPGRQPPAAPGLAATSPPVVVRAGDTLWGIAARHLRDRPPPALIARAWPRWYRANRRVVGPDPDLLRPGERLRAPVPLTPKELP